MRNYTLTTVVLIGSFLLFLQSCSIEKRRYTGGFHIEKHTSHKRHLEPEIAVHKSDSTTSIAKTQSEPVADSTPLMSDDSVETENQLNTTEEDIVASSEESPTPVLASTNAVTRLTNHVETLVSKYDHYGFAEKKKKKKKNLGKQAGYMGVAAWIISILAFVMAVGGSLSIGAYLMLSLTAFIMAICALVFGAMSVKKAKKGKGKGGAVIGIILGGLYLLIGIIGAIIILGA